MRIHHARRFSRREVPGRVTLAGTAGLLGLHPRPVAAEPPPETTKLRLIQIPGICVAPQYVAEELLRGEGFTEVQYVETVAGSRATKALASGEVHLTLSFAGPVHHPGGRGGSDRHPGGGACRLLRAVRDGAGPRDP